MSSLARPPGQDVAGISMRPSLPPPIQLHAPPGTIRDTPRHTTPHHAPPRHATPHIATHPSFLKQSSVWKVLPWPLPPQMPRMRGVRHMLSKAPASIKKFLAMCRATFSKNLQQRGVCACRWLRGGWDSALLLRGLVAGDGLHQLNAAAHAGEPRRHSSPPGGNVVVSHNVIVCTEVVGAQGSICAGITGGRKEMG